MPIYDFYCEPCDRAEEIICKVDEGAICPRCMKPMKRQISRCSFRLLYDPKIHCCDWEGNDSMYWKDVKDARARGEKVKAYNE